MKKIQAPVKDPSLNTAMSMIQENFREVFLRSMQSLPAAPTENLTPGMIYFDTALQKLRCLISADPVTWKNIKFDD